MDWQTAITLAIGALLGWASSEFSAVISWRRSAGVRTEERRREDERRWDQQRIGAYSELFGAVIQLTGDAGRLAEVAHVDIEDLPEDIKKNRGRHRVIDAYARAFLIASNDLKPFLIRLFEAAIQNVADELVAVGEGKESADEFSARYSEHVGDRLSEFAHAVSKELGIDPIGMHKRPTG